MSDAPIHGIETHPIHLGLGEVVEQRHPADDPETPVDYGWCVFAHLISPSTLLTASMKADDLLSSSFLSVRTPVHRSTP